MNGEEVADIFVRVNSEGVKLNQADFILTLLSVFLGQGIIRLGRLTPLPAISSIAYDADRRSDPTPSDNSTSLRRAPVPGKRPSNLLLQRPKCVAGTGTDGVHVLAGLDARRVVTLLKLAGETRPWAVFLYTSADCKART